MLVPTIGIEVHVELKSKSKVYSTSKNAFSNEPNTFVNEIDLGYPGTLPKLNKEVINMALKASIACHCHINKRMHWDRKNYFYPDLPKGYQITQQDTPIGYDGYLEINVDGQKKKIGMERIHIEEDTCKSIHGLSGTMLNFNRAGVPLIEVVSKPDMKSDKEAVAYLETLRETLLYLGISDVKIEEGSMRCDCNISLSEEGSDKLGTKIEIKNIGSISNVGLAILYETKRQREILENGGTLKEETRRFDDHTGTTILMRVKETGNDYRYFPEPDIPYVELSDEWIQDVENNMPVLPTELRNYYREVGINENAIQTLISNIELSKYLEEVKKLCNPVAAANFLTGDLLSYLNKKECSLESLHMSKEGFCKVVSLLEEKKLSSKQLKDFLPVFLESKKEPEEIMKELGMVQITDENALLSMVKEVIEKNPNSVEDFKNGLDRAVKYLMGQIMKESKGKANPQLVMELLVQELKKY